jgi:hypothetical protein
LEQWPKSPITIQDGIAFLNAKSAQIDRFRMLTASRSRVQFLAWKSAKPVKTVSVISGAGPAAVGSCKAIKGRKYKRLADSSFWSSMQIALPGSCADSSVSKENSSDCHPLWTGNSLIPTPSADTPRRYSLPCPKSLSECLRGRHIAGEILSYRNHVKIQLSR